MRKTVFQSTFLSLSVLIAVSVTAWATPDTICIQGVLKGADGKTLTGERAWRIQFHDAETWGNSLGAAVGGTVAVAASGRFSIDLVPPAEALASDGPIWYQLAIDSATTPDGTIDLNDIFPNRVAVHSVLFAQRTARADTATNADRATTATHSGTADVAALALTANEAATAFFAENANHATIADSATSATFAQTAGHASTANALQGEAFVMVRALASPTLNAANLQAAYAQAKTLTPHGLDLSATNRAVVIVPPGRYDFSTGTLTLDIEFVDLIGLTTNRDVQRLFGATNGLGTGVLTQTANNIRIENLSVEYTGPDGGYFQDNSRPAAYFPDTAPLPQTVVRNCAFLGLYSMRTSIGYAGNYKDCVAGDNAFGGGFGQFVNSGTFTDCTAGDGSFGSSVGAIVSGTFTNCVAGDYSYGTGISSRISGTFTDCKGGNSSFTGSVVSGTFSNCTAGDYSFGSGTTSGTFTNCVAGDNSFGVTATGTFTDCAAGDRSFGYVGTVSGTFERCEGGEHSFGGYGGRAEGTFTDCIGGDYAFGGDRGTASGVFTNCTGRNHSFGGNGTAPGGKFYYCRGEGVGSFTTDAGTGTAPVHLFCIRDGVAWP